MRCKPGLEQTITIDRLQVVYSDKDLRIELQQRYSLFRAASADIVSVDIVSVDKEKISSCLN